MTWSCEENLIACCRRGDSAAWDHLFGQHYAATSRFIFQLSADLLPDDVEEICQETFLAVIRNLESFRGQSRLQTWIFRIAANKTRDFRQHQFAAKRGAGKLPISLQAETPEFDCQLDPPDGKPGPDLQLMRNEQAAQITKALDQLGNPCREIIELRYFGDLSYEEISAELKLNSKTVSSRLSKCLDRLEGIMKRIFSGSGSTSVSV